MLDGLVGEAKVNVAKANVNWGDETPQSHKGMHPDGRRTDEQIKRRKIEETRIKTRLDY